MHEPRGSDAGRSDTNRTWVPIHMTTTSATTPMPSGAIPPTLDAQPEPGALQSRPTLLAQNTLPPPNTSSLFRTWHGTVLRGMPTTVAPPVNTTSPAVINNTRPLTLVPQLPGVNTLNIVPIPGVQSLPAPTTANAPSLRSAQSIVDATFTQARLDAFNQLGPEQRIVAASIISAAAACLVRAPDGASRPLNAQEFESLVDQAIAAGAAYQPAAANSATSAVPPSQLSNSTVGTSSLPGTAGENVDFNAPLSSSNPPTNNPEQPTPPANTPPASNQDSTPAANQSGTPPGNPPRPTAVGASGEEPPDDSLSAQLNTANQQAEAAFARTRQGEPLEQVWMELRRNADGAPAGSALQKQHQLTMAFFANKWLLATVQERGPATLEQQTAWNNWAAA